MPINQMQYLTDVVFSLRGGHTDEDKHSEKRHGSEPLQLSELRSRRA